MWWDCASLLETVGSGGNKFVPMFYTFPRVVSRVNILILNFSPAPVARPTMPSAARESSRMFLFTDPNVFSAFALCSARKAPFLSEKLLAGRLSPTDKVAAATIKQFHLPERLLIFFRRQCVNSRFRKMW